MNSFYNGDFAFDFIFTKLILQEINPSRFRSCNTGYHQTLKIDNLLIKDKYYLMKNPVILILLLCCISGPIFGQNVGTAYSSFIDVQKSYSRPGDALKRKEDTLKAQFERKGLEWPAKYVYIRSFKYDSQLEVWVKNDPKEQYKLFNTYRICALAGSLGPKRIEGDYQVPEGFYYINEFNPRSTYHLSLGLNYPNASDRILSDAFRPGGDIYIHGSCVTVGCIPLTDGQIEDLYILAAHAKDQGQDFIPVHIFPIRFNVPRSSDYLAKLTKIDSDLKHFSEEMEDAFDYFEKYKQVPIIMVNEKGDYLVAGASKNKREDEEVKVKKEKLPLRQRNITEVADVVHQWPQYPGGGDAFLKYLKSLGKDMVQYLPRGLEKAYVMVEFIIDKDGTPTNFNVVRGISEDFDYELVKSLEKMPNWKPAELHDRAVAKKMKQSIEISAQ